MKMYDCSDLKSTHQSEVPEMPATSNARTLQKSCVRAFDLHREVSLKSHAHRISLSAPISIQETIDLSNCPKKETVAYDKYLVARERLLLFLRG